MFAAAWYPSLLNRQPWPLRSMRGHQVHFVADRERMVFLTGPMRTSVTV